MIGLPANKPLNGLAAYDLGWVIQNQQINDTELCSFLLEELSPEIDRLVSRFMKSPADRIAAVDQVLFKVLDNRRMYKGNKSGKAWLYGLVLAVCLGSISHQRLPRKISLRQVMSSIDTRPAGDSHLIQIMDSLTAGQRLFAVLHYGQNLRKEDIAQLLTLSIRSVDADLAQVKQAMVAHLRSCDDCSARYGSISAMETALGEAYQSKEPLIEIARTDRSEWASSLLNRLDRAKTTQRKRRWASRIIEFGLAAVILVFGELALTQSGPFQPQASPPAETAAILASATDITPGNIPTFAPTSSPPPAMTTVENDGEDFLTLSLTSWARWQTLWADVEVQNYNVENYADGAASAPHEFLRKQIWLSQPGYSRVVSGPTTGSPEITYAINNKQAFGQNFDSGQIITSSASNLIPDAELRKLFSPLDMFPLGGQVKRIGADIIAGRQAWVLEWRDNGRTIYRYWVDQEYGVILRRLEFGVGAFRPLASDITVTKIYYDANIPTSIYESFRYRGDHFAYDFSGNPEILDYKSSLETWKNPGSENIQAGKAPPTGANLANAHLYFLNVPAGWLQSSDGPGLELFANQYDLGKLPLGGNSILACERSSDGSRIAYNSPPVDESGDNALRVADLASIQSARPPLPGGITAGDFAFSPDSTRLAFFGCEKATNYCGIFILDLATWKLTRLTPMTYADYMIWSPDGHSIALVSKDDLSGSNKKLATANLLMNEAMALLHPWFFQVIDTRSGDVSYKRPFDWSNLGAPSDSPTVNWTVPFKIQASNAGGCKDPPVKAAK